MKIKGVIFDMDGLMLDTEKLLMRFWIESANQFGFDMKKEHVLSIRSLAGKYAVPKLQGIFGESFDYDAVRKRRIELMNEYIAENGIEKKKGLDELLSYLSGKYRIAVATATDYERTEMYLKKVGVFDFFDKIICGSMVENGKPAPDIYLKASSELCLAPEECAALEDSPNGILSAYRAGCKPIMIPDLSQPDEETSKLLYAKADSLDKVIDILS
ncbi:MAG: HAD family phosphatase [Clostridium sp.]|nr:HAD family phosphatase [Clostridium sp.]MCM1547029.1 HAD family phosphatase [Ruminococcus sp.]